MVLSWYGPGTAKIAGILSVFGVCSDVACAVREPRLGDCTQAWQHQINPFTLNRVVGERLGGGGCGIGWAKAIGRGKGKIPWGIFGGKL